MIKDNWITKYQTNKNIKNTEYFNEINDISKKILENKVILFLGAGFSCNFGLPSWKKLIKEIIFQGIKINEKMNYTNQIENLNYIEQSLDNQSLLLILDIILENIPSLINSEKRKIFLENIYKKELSFKKYIIDNHSFDKQEMSLNIRILIDKIFNKILTINYDDIFDYSNGKEIKKRWKYINEIISTPNQNYDKWIYPIHGTIVNENNLPIIDTYLSFIENWKDIKFNRNFQKLLENSINDKHIFLFIGCSFNDNFVLNEITTFINKNNYFNKEEILFYVLWDNINEDKNTKKYKVDKHKFPSLSQHWGSIKFIRLSNFSKNHKIEIDSKSNCVTNFFNYIYNILETNKKNFTLLNDISKVKFSECIKEKFDIEKYFKKLISSINNETKTFLDNLSEEEIIFIISLYNQKKELLKELKKEDFYTLYYKFITILWEFIIKKKLNNSKISNFIINSELFIDILDWVHLQSNENLLSKLGDMYNV